MLSSRYAHLFYAILSCAAVAAIGIAAIHWMADSTPTKPRKLAAKTPAAIDEDVPRRAPQKSEPFVLKREPAPAVQQDPEPETQSPEPDAIPEPPVVDRQAIEKTAWDRASKANKADSYQAYLKEFPKGQFASHAKAALANLNADRDFEQLKGVCFGKGAAGAAAYELRTGVHPVVVLTSDGDLHFWHYEFPDDWQGGELARTELVAIIHPPESVLLEVVHYQSPAFPDKEAPSLSRYRQTLQVDLLEAKTAKRRATMAFHADPRPARPAESYLRRRLDGAVQRAAVEEWMRRHVVTYHEIYRPTTPNPKR